MSLMRVAKIGMVDAFSAIDASWPMPAPQSVGTGAAVTIARNPTPVLQSLRPFSHALRASFLVLLVLGLMSRPATGLGCDLLAMEHGTSVTGQSHAHGDHPAPHGDQAHAKGAHTLMHQHFAGASVDASATRFVLADARTSPVPSLDCVAVSRLQLAVPFRPPIA